MKKAKTTKKFEKELFEEIKKGTSCLTCLMMLLINEELVRPKHLKAVYAHSCNSCKIDIKHSFERYKIDFSSLDLKKPEIPSNEKEFFNQFNGGD